jgi:hypothetical protein
MKSGWLAGLTGAIAVLCLVGCDGIGVPTAPVEGTVTVAGKPMEGITVTFTPDAGRVAQGITDASGKFTLNTLSSKGAVPGKHKVSFAYTSVKLDASGKPPPGMGPDNINTGKGPPVMPGAPFNSKYSSPATSGIEVEVVADKTNTVGPWDLEK